MVDTASAKAQSFMQANPHCKLEFEVSGVIEMLPQAQYDFITIGQALHFFPIEDSLRRKTGSL